MANAADTFKRRDWNTLLDEDGSKDFTVERILADLRLVPEIWNHPPQFTTMHRPGIASIQGDTIVLDGTTMDELERYHVETLHHVITKLNDDVRQAEERERAQRRQQQAFVDKHRREVDDAADRLGFD